MKTMYRVDFEASKGQVLPGRWVEGASFDSMTEANLYGIQKIQIISSYGYKSYRVVPVSVPK